MKFSICFEAQMVDTSPESEQRTFYEAVEQTEYADKMGFDGVWAVEHHALTQYSHMSSPETFLAFVAARTERIRIGHGVICLPPQMNHPVKVAERIAGWLNPESPNRLWLERRSDGKPGWAGAGDIMVLLRRRGDGRRNNGFAFRQIREELGGIDKKNSCIRRG